MESDDLSSVSALLFPSFLAFNKAHNYIKFNFIHLWNGTDSITYLIGLLWDDLKCSAQCLLHSKALSETLPQLLLSSRLLGPKAVIMLLATIPSPPFFPVLAKDSLICPVGTCSTFLCANFLLDPFLTSLTSDGQECDLYVVKIYILTDFITSNHPSSFNLN